jgi:hypothetical protein
VVPYTNQIHRNSGLLITLIGDFKKDPQVLLKDDIMEIVESAVDWTTALSTAMIIGTAVKAASNPESSIS